MYMYVCMYVCMYVYGNGRLYMYCNGRWSCLLLLYYVISCATSVYVFVFVLCCVVRSSITLS